MTVDKISLEARQSLFWTMARKMGKFIFDSRNSGDSVFTATQQK